MKPPALAQAIVAAAAPASDYEIIAGDLHEEYLRLVDTHAWSESRKPLVLDANIALNTIVALVFAIEAIGRLAGT